MTTYIFNISPPFICIWVFEDAWAGVVKVSNEMATSHPWIHLQVTLIQIEI